MKINRKILSIPPHISTAWRNIASLHISPEGSGKTLIITLVNDSVIKIPGLDETTIKEIFTMHSNYIEQESEQESPPTQELPSLESTKPVNPFAFGGENALTFGFPVKLGDIDSIGNFGGLLQHSQQQANSPNLPQDMIKKITSISKAIGLDNQLENMPKAEPHCNCPYCQIARALHEEPSLVEKEKKVKEEEEEVVSDEELKFREWDIQEIGKDLYEIRNPFDVVEHYQVFLGNPVGCTCGHKNCEHIKAVLNS